jgi:hypothetical protein
MRTPNHIKARRLAPAIADELLAGLLARGLITPGDELGVLIAARDSFRGEHTADARASAAWLEAAIRARTH